MSEYLLLYIYLTIGCGFAIAAEETDSKWKWWGLLILALLWPGAVAYAIGKIKVQR